MLTIRGEKKSTISIADRLPVDSELDGVLLVDCAAVELDFMGVHFSSNALSPVHVTQPLVEVRDSTDCLIRNVTHHNSYEEWLQLDWRCARSGILLRGNGCAIEQCALSGVRFGVGLLAPYCSVLGLSVEGFSADALRLLSDNAQASQVQIAKAFWGDEREHSDGVQLFPMALPEEQRTKSLRNIKLRDIYIENRSDFAPLSRWMQGIILSDGSLHDAELVNIHIDTDHEVGLQLAEAHDVSLRNINLKHADSKLKIGTSKADYCPSTNVRMSAITAPEIVWL
ncbi:hypothetical protein [Thiolinea disciformis]|uniref:hypothetical protein n=1 Tax=Thiolinea disciformis TaxID=125614 RepID=UPI000371D209|nr:hypothetical protein [Thiolinea disciformis]